MLHALPAPAAVAAALFALLASGSATAQSSQMDTARSPANNAWWHEMGDAQLARLIDAGVANNLDLDAAWARVQQADARSRQALAPMLPSARLEAGANAAPFDSLGFQFGGLPIMGPSDEDPPEVYFTGSAALKAQLNADIWGRNYLQYRATRYDAQAQRGDREAQVLALANRIALAYYDIASAREQLGILQQQRETNASLLELLELRYRRGEGSALAVLQQRQQLAATEALMPQARLVERVRVEELATLLGRASVSDESIDGAKLREPGPLPTTTTEALDRRPDLKAARLRLRATEARSRSAVRALLPTLRVSGQGGVDVNHIDELKSQGVWGAGLSLSVPLFEGGQNYARIDEADASYRVSRNSYEQLRLQARQEVQISLSQAEEQQHRLEALERQAETAKVAFTEARARYLAGLDTYLDVQTALGVMQQTELSLVQARKDLITSRIQFYTAVGGPVARPGQGEPS